MKSKKVLSVLVGFILLFSLTACDGAITPKVNSRTNSGSNTGSDTSTNSRSNTGSNTSTNSRSNTGSGTGTNSETNARSSYKAKCDISECLKKLDQHSTLEQINSVIGFEGTKGTSSSDYTKYSWDLGTDAKLVATIYSTSTSLSLDVKDDLIKNSKVNFSKYDEVKKAIQGGQKITYDEVKSKFGADGVLIEVS